MIPPFMSLLFYDLFTSQEYHCRSRTQKDPLLALKETLFLRHAHKSSISHEPLDYLGHRTRTDMHCSLVLLFFLRIGEIALCHSSFWGKLEDNWMLGHPFTTQGPWVILWAGHFIGGSRHITCSRKERA